MLLPTLPVALLPLVARGARVFRDAAPTLDRILTLPGRSGTVMLVPRGHGAPRLALEAQGQFRDANTGVVCSTVRWESGGSVAAWLREAGLPRLGTPVSPVRLCARGATRLRVHKLALTAARCGDGAGVVVSGGRVRATNARAAARGVRVGAREAEANALGATLYAQGPEAARLAALEDWLHAEYGATQRVRGGFLIPGTPDGGEVAALGALAQLRARVWQATGLIVKAVAAPTAASAVRLGRRLAGSYVAVVPAGAERLWSAEYGSTRLRSGRTAGSWHGQAIVDVEGILVLAQALLASARGTVRLRMTTDRGVLRVVVEIPQEAGRTEVQSRVETAVRRALGSGTAAWALSWDCTPPVTGTVRAPVRQVALWA